MIGLLGLFAASALLLRAVAAATLRLGTYSLPQLPYAQQAVCSPQAPSFYQRSPCRVVLVAFGFRLPLEINLLVASSVQALARGALALVAHFGERVGAQPLLR